MNPKIPPFESGGWFQRAGKMYNPGSPFKSMPPWSSLWLLPFAGLPSPHLVESDADGSEEDVGSSRCQDWTLLSVQLKSLEKSIHPGRALERENTDMGGRRGGELRALDVVNPLKKGKTFWNIFLEIYLSHTLCWEKNKIHLSTRKRKP